MEKDNNKQMATASKVDLPINISDPADVERIKRELINVKSIDDALVCASDNKKFPSLSVLTKWYSREAVEDILKVLLLDFRRNVSVKYPLSDSQIETVSLEVVSLFYYFTIADIYLVLRKAMVGDYGSFYERIDTHKILGWFRDYNNERMNTATQDSINTSGTWNVNDYRRESERMTKYFDKLQNRLKQK